MVLIGDRYNVFCKIRRGDNQYDPQFIQYSLGVLFAYLGQIYTARNGHATICCAFDNLSFVYGYILVFLLLFPCFFWKVFCRGGVVMFFNQHFPD